MCCPILKELPSPPLGKIGWPWTEESTRLQNTMPDVSQWPKISIVTPSLNQGQFIEETIRSVLLQGYPNLEYMIIDGGSTDGSINIIRKYEKWLSYWISEPDRGQSHALNKGFSKSTGEIINWLNADDLYLKGGLQDIRSIFQKYPDHMIIASGIDFDEQHKNEVIVFPQKISVKNIIKFWEGWHDWLQPSIFFPKSAFFEVGALDENLHFSMDTDLYCRLMQSIPLVYTDTTVSKFRRHALAKTSSQYHLMMIEHIKVSFKYKHLLSKLDADNYESEALLFILRRIKHLLLDKQFGPIIKYLHCALNTGILKTFLALLNAILYKTRQF